MRFHTATTPPPTDQHSGNAQIVLTHSQMSQKVKLNTLKPFKLILLSL